MTRGQRITAILLMALIVFGLIRAPLATARLLVLLCTVFYQVATIYKMWLVRSATQPGAFFRFTPEMIAAEEPREWPVYSIIVPMYKEPETIPQMIAGLKALDYPPERLDIQLLLEADDDATLNAARAQVLPPQIRITEIPPSFPRTKPKACNIGLHLARGKYLVIYDAEDKPEPDQLKKAVMSFDRSPDNVVCIQSCLNYYNPRYNLLTRWFAADYSAWFDLCLPGLAARRTVIPLGGTSNHFNTQVLRDLLGGCLHVSRTATSGCGRPAPAKTAQPPLGGLQQPALIRQRLPGRRAISDPARPHAARSGAASSACASASTCDRRLGLRV